MCIGDIFDEAPSGSPTATRPGRKAGESRGRVVSGSSPEVLRSLNFEQFVSASGGLEALVERLDLNREILNIGPGEDIAQDVARRAFAEFRRDPERFGFLIGEGGPRSTGPGRFEGPREDTEQTGAGNLRFDELRIRR